MLPHSNSASAIPSGLHRQSGGNGGHGGIGGGGGIGGSFTQRTQL
jgi:hypothetical protein